MSNRDMDVFELEPGLWVTEDGEIIGDAEGGDALAYTAARIAGWQEQVRQYEAAIGAGKRALLTRLTERRTVVGDYVASVRQNSRRVLDLPALRDAMREIEFGREELEALVFAATGFDAGLVADDPALAALITDHVEEFPNHPYVVITPVLRDAPVALRMPRSESEAS